MGSRILLFFNFRKLYHSTNAENFNGSFFPVKNFNCHSHPDKRVARKRVTAAAINYDLSGGSGRP